ncbi:uncharacterized protein LOC121260294 [Juglans microcarpa x Juglans regia]|uniref:uncharacterized protein LOC121260294 n=1 Tax=Juglans microcarpa x Juglans regia TaxID=2249226 RepID=UPI001B7E9619|nr:uncharacterized protein LOC121260294 [Juglans microcarpa x Juglans regia]
MRDHSKSPHFQNQEEEAAEEALALCHLPVDDNNNENDNQHNCCNNDSKCLSNHNPRSRSEPPDIFEFFSDFSSDMCPADDIFFCGKLVPFEGKSPPTHDQTPKTSATDENQTRKTHCRRRCESLSKLQSPVTGFNTSIASTTKLMRNSRSLDYRKLHPSSISMISTAPEIERNPSVRSVGKYDIALKKAAKPRWYLLMFGMVKFPPEMELSDIKNRQVRRNAPSTLFPPPLDFNRNLPVSRSSSTKGSWRFLRALSCKDHASVTVTASFCFPDE